MIPSPGIRLRLALLWAGIGLIGALALELAGVAVLTAQLNAAVDRDLLRETRDYEKAVATAQDMAELQTAAENFLRDEPATGGTAVIYRISFVDGTVLTNTTESDLLELLGGSRPNGYSTAHSDRHGDYRVASTALIQRDVKVGEFHVGTSLGPGQQTVQQVIWPLFALGCVIVLITSVFAYLLLGRALRPLRWIQETAESIEEGDLQRRITYRGPKDEVGRLAETFDAMLGRLDQSFREREGFYALASHELRTPLTIARGHLEVLRREPEPSPEHVMEAVEVSLEEINRLISAVNDMLLLGRMLLGQTGSSTRVDLANVAFEALRKTEPLAARDWRSQIRPVYVRADSEQLQRAVMNLLMNAIRHTKDGDRIEVATAPKGGFGVVIVSDSGSGVNGGDLERIFTPWYRTAHSAPGGHGLGLAVVRAVARAHGGQARAAPRPEGGISFFIELPRLPGGVN